MIIYDEETYPNVFTLAAESMVNDVSAVFEISHRRNDIAILLEWCEYLQRNQIEMIGYNNEHFDYPILHMIMQMGTSVTCDAIYQKSQGIIHGGDRFAHNIWPNDRFIPQIDLMKIHHFDNKARATRLKDLQFNMRSESVDDLPFPPGTVLTDDEIDTLITYNKHDVSETKKFALLSEQQIEFRRYLSDKYKRNFMNHNDTKIGKDYFIMELEKAVPGSCYDKSSGRRKPKQTNRPVIHFNEVVFPYIQFQHPEFNRILNWFKNQTITRDQTDDNIKLKGFFTDVSALVNGFEFDFGLGGIHGSMKGAIVRSDDAHSVIDLDVTSYYPTLAIANRVYPAHLPASFCDIYLDVFNQRKQYDKKAPENGMLKLALNGVYGDSNNVYSPFYDPQYAMMITVNGQLLLCMLAEHLMNVPGLTMIQINTDGLTVKCPRAMEWMVEQIKDWWQQYTCLQLEEARYSAMYIRDVNNYIAVDEDGEVVKRKGAYETAQPGDRKPLGWHQDCSQLVVTKAAEATLVYGQDTGDFIRSHTDPFDFMIRAKVKRGSNLVMAGQNGAEIPLQSTTRYYIANQGGSMFKTSPPPEGCIDGMWKRKGGVTKKQYDAFHAQHGNDVWSADIHTGNKSKYGTTRTGVSVGWLTAECNVADKFDWSNVNYDYYIAEARKLIDPLREITHPG